jgi:hypothetical protein
MQSFIVLGIIPGTDIQTNLNFWIMVAALSTLFLLRSPIAALYSAFKHFVALREIANVIEHYEFTVPA